MTYELAKQLKDVGFPQDGRGYTPDHGADEATWAYFPTLSKLIAACGNRFEILLRNNDGKFACGVWIDEQQINEITDYYSFPKEAVAALYLKLHENDKKS